MLLEPERKKRNLAVRVIFVLATALLLCVLIDWMLRR